MSRELPWLQRGRSRSSLPLCREEIHTRCLLKETYQRTGGRPLGSRSVCPSPSILEPLLLQEGPRIAPLLTLARVLGTVWGGDHRQGCRGDRDAGLSAGGRTL